MVALATMHAGAQTVPGALPGMRSTIDADTDTGSPLRRARKQPKSTSTSASQTPVGQLPSFGVPPARGAGETGFDSTNARRKTKTRPVGGTTRTEPVAGPTKLLPSEAFRSGQKAEKKAGQSSASDKAKQDKSKRTQKGTPATKARAQALAKPVRPDPA